jgi:hypothetical protein
MSELRLGAIDADLAHWAPGRQGGQGVIDSPATDAYRARLDALGLDAGEVQRVVEEVKVAFRLNQALFTELGQNIDGYRR